MVSKWADEAVETLIYGNTFHAMRAINTTEATGWTELKPFYRLLVSMIIDWIQGHPTRI